MQFVTHLIEGPGVISLIVARSYILVEIDREIFSTVVFLLKMI